MPHRSCPAGAGRRTGFVRAGSGRTALQVRRALGGVGHRRRRPWPGRRTPLARSSASGSARTVAPWGPGGPVCRSPAPAWPGRRHRPRGRPRAPWRARGGRGGSAAPGWVSDRAPALVRVPGRGGARGSGRGRGGRFTGSTGSSAGQGRFGAGSGTGSTAGHTRGATGSGTGSTLVVDPGKWGFVRIDVPGVVGPGVVARLVVVRVG